MVFAIVLAGGYIWSDFRHLDHNQDHLEPQEQPTSVFQKEINN